MLILGERNHAVADISGRKDVEIFAETARGTSVVGDGDDGCEVADEARKLCGMHFSARLKFGMECNVGGAARGNRRSDVALEAAKKCGETGSSTDGNDTQRLRSGMRDGRHYCSHSKWNEVRRFCRFVNQASG
jgi:hypothetical protein